MSKVDWSTDRRMSLFLLSIAANRAATRHRDGWAQLLCDGGIKSVITTPVEALRAGAKTVTRCVVQEIARELAHQYALAYVPTSRARDRKFRRVAVAVDQPDVRVRTRTGYIAE